MPKASKKTQQDDILQQVERMAGIEAGVLEPKQQQQQQQHAAAAAAAGPKPKFAPLSSYEQNGKKIEFRRVPVPQHRMTPLKNNWLSLYKPVTENLKLDMRMNLKTRKVLLLAAAAQAAGGEAVGYARRWRGPEASVFEIRAANCAG